MHAYITSDCSVGLDKSSSTCLSTVLGLTKVTHHDLESFSTCQSVIHGES